MFPEDETGTAPAQVDPPTVLGLDTLELIATGGHGSVYRAFDRRHDRIVALKVLTAPFVDDATRHRFDQERLALGRVSDHPAIVSLLDSGYTDQGAPYLLLEYTPGGSLAPRIATSPLTFDEASALTISLAAAVERAHANGIVHCDIKPANILRSAYGTWKLADFGIASLADQTQARSRYASYAHSAPETFRGVAPTPAADIYSLASVLATCLSGTEPFAMLPGEDPVAVMQRIMSDRYPEVRTAYSSIEPRRLHELLAMALSKDPSDRPVSARSFGAALNDIRQGCGLASVPLLVGGDGLHSREVTEVVDDTLAMDEADMAIAAATILGGMAVPAPRASLRRRRRAASLMVAGLLALGAVGVGTVSASEPAGTSGERPATAAPGTVPGIDQVTAEDVAVAPDVETEATAVQSNGRRRNAGRGNN